MCVLMHVCLPCAHSTHVCMCVCTDACGMHVCACVCISARVLHVYGSSVLGITVGKTKAKPKNWKSVRLWGRDAVRGGTFVPRLSGSVTKQGLHLCPLRWKMLVPKCWVKRTTAQQTEGVRLDPHFNQPPTRMPRGTNVRNPWQIPKLAAGTGDPRRRECGEVGNVIGFFLLNFVLSHLLK